MAKSFLKQYEIFHKKAVIDLNMAKIALVEFEKGEIELDFEVVFFHLQQCAEKLFKSVLDYHKIKFPKTHDLALLIKLLKDNSIKVIPNIESLIPLTDFAVEGRYDIIEEDLENADQYIKILDSYFEFLK